MVALILASLAACSSTSTEQVGQTHQGLSELPPWIESDPTAYPSDEIWTYAPNSPSAIAQNSVSTTGSMNGHAVNISVETNPIVGNAIVRYWHDGTQFINNWNPGTMMQTAIFQGESPCASGPEPFVNPTEGGDSTNHGSISSYFFTTNAGPNPYLQSSTFPLDYNPDGPNSPNYVPDEEDLNADQGVAAGSVEIYWGLELGKFFALNFYYPNAALWQPVVDNVGSQTISSYTWSSAAFLRGNFNQVIQYDAASGATQSVSTPDCGYGEATWSPGDGSFTSDACGGIIATDPNPADPEYGKAFGLYGCNPQFGGQGSVNAFMVTNYACSTYSSAEAGSSFIAFTAWFDNVCDANGPGNPAVVAPQTARTMNVYVVTGDNVGEVTSTMSGLYQVGVR